MLRRVPTGLPPLLLAALAILLAISWFYGVLWLYGVLRVALWNVSLVALILLCAVGLVVGIRRFGRVPSELDRIGSDLSLYGYGVGLSFLFGAQIGRRVLPWVPPARVTLVIVLSILVTLFFYLVNLYLSDRIRHLDPHDRYLRGLDSFDDFREVVANPQGRRYIIRSLTLGFIPTLGLIIFDIIPE